MGIVKPKSGEVITPESIEDMHLRPQKKVNASTEEYMQDAALGPQHLPSIHHTSDYKSFFAPNVIITNAHTMELESISDVTSSNWADVMSLDNSGVGYTLPPCKILVMFDCDLKYINKNSSGPSPSPTGDNQAWFAVYWQRTEGGLNWNRLGDGAIGMVSAYNPDPTYSSGVGQKVREHISIWFIIDGTSLGEQWLLSKIQVRAACGWGSLAVPENEKPESIEIGNGSLSFCALMTDVN